MSVDQKVSALTAAIKDEFWKGWESISVPAPWEDFTTIIPSTTRIEHYLNATPVPGFQLWKGHRNYGKIDSFVYSVQNSVYHSEILATLDDIDDEQTGLLPQRAKDLVVKGKIFPGRAVIKALSQGASNLCFDGSKFFAASHNFGTGANSIGVTCVGTSDSVTTNLVGLFYGNSVLKPMIWQNRSGPDFETNSGTPQSKESRQVRWWADLRGAAAYGYWWNAVYVRLFNTPSVVDIHTAFAAMEKQFRSFYYPLTISSEDPEYVHEQTVFSDSNFVVAASTGIADQVRQALTGDWVPQTVGGGNGATTSQTVADTNRFKGYAKYLVSSFLN